ncbi:MAG: phosphatidate cytidylyltransferase [Chloroflexota bacterium]|jgi:phosphatidate cytidylyltransferase|tara:strand:+ start:21528 stop:22421 length:894 start_codon:yes stop_codon:yes gene_type:complete
MTELWRLNITTIAKNPKVQNFFIRTLVTAFLVPITFLVIWAGGWWLTVLITICAILGGWELASLVASDKGKLIKFICSIWSGALVVVMHLYLEDFGFMFTVFPVLVSIPFVLMICTFWKVLVTKQDALRKLFQITSSLSKNSFVALVVGGLLSFALLLNDLQAGRDWIYSIIVVVAATDVASYIFGSLFGKHKLVPKISPSKTWEGGIAGLTFAIFASVIVYYLLDLPTNLGLSIVFGVVIYFSALIGDLLESSLKRLVGVKDSGSLIPGHGGILDRMDSILISLFVGYFFVLWTID